MSLLIAACMPENVGNDGTCMAVVWIEKPEPVFPPLTVAQGAEIGFLIASVWAMGLAFRLYVRATQTNRY
jgi:hypothetical protein